MNWNNITDSEKVKQLFIDRKQIEDKIKKIDEMALINYELELLAMDGGASEIKQIQGDD